MIEKITDYLIKRRKKKAFIPVTKGSTSPRDEFNRVLNSLRENKIMVTTKDDGIYIRMAGNEDAGYCYSTEFTKVKSF